MLKWFEKNKKVLVYIHILLIVNYVLQCKTYTYKSNYGLAANPHITKVIRKHIPS